VFGGINDTLFNPCNQQGNSGPCQFSTCQKESTDKVSPKPQEVFPTCKKESTDKVSPKPQEIIPSPEDIKIESVNQSIEEVNKPIVNINEKVEEQVKKPEEYQKVEDPVIYPKLDEFPKQNQEDDKMKKDIYIVIMKELRQNYDLSMFSNSQILDAIEKAQGNADDVFNYLFSS